MSRGRDMTMLRTGLLLILVLALWVKKGGSSSKPEKWRQKLKAVLFEYKTKEEGGREPTRQVGHAWASAVAID